MNGTYISLQFDMADRLFIFATRHSFNTVHTYMYCVHCAKLLSKSVNKRAEIYHKHLNGICKLIYI